MNKTSARTWLALGFVSVAAASWYMTRSTPPESLSTVMGAAGNTVQIGSSPILSEQELDLQQLSAERIRRIDERFAAATTEINASFRESGLEYVTADRTKWNPAILSAFDRMASNLQAGLGPVDYDWLLYRHKIENRLVVATVPEGETDGRSLLPGDVFYSYGRQRVFTYDDLRRGLAQATLDQPIQVRVLRDNVLVDMELRPRLLDPLGYTFEARRERPEDPSTATVQLRGNDS